MQAIVALLDDQHYQLTEALWRELEARFGLRGVYTTPYPHFSYHVARSYASEALAATLQQFTRTTRPFEITTSGLGVFTGPSPVLYIPIVRTPTLTEFHQTLCREVEKCASGSARYYDPAHWLPHITIGWGDLHGGLLAEVIQLLGERDFNWTIRINNLAVVEEDAVQEQRLGYRLAFAEGTNDRADLP